MRGRPTKPAIGATGGEERAHGGAAHDGVQGRGQLAEHLDFAAVTLIDSGTPRASTNRILCSIFSPGAVGLGPTDCEPSVPSVMPHR